MPKPYIPNDAWSRKAAKEGFRARSVYKLQELDERFRLLRPGMTVLDIGAAPGSWLQYAAARVLPGGRIIGIDLQTIAPVADHVITALADITDTEAIVSILYKNCIQEVDLVLSDLAPSTSGIRDVDQWRSIELNQCVSAIATRCLREGGWCILKVLRGADFDEFLRELKRTWRTVKQARVQATRDRSNEIYLLLRHANTV